MANRFWVGGTGTWDATAGTKWALSSGGAGGQAVPTASDVVTFDNGAGGNGAVTIGTGYTPLSSSITCSAFTGTLDFSNATGPISTGVFSNSSSSLNTVNLGSLTWNFTAASGNVFVGATGTGQTYSNATLNFTATAPTGARTFTTGGQTYGAVSASAISETMTGGLYSNGNNQLTITGTSNTTTFASLSLNGPIYIVFSNNQTYTINTTPTTSSWVAGQTTPIYVAAGAGAPATLVFPAGNINLSWVNPYSIKWNCGANTVTLSNAFDIGGPNSTAGGTTLALTNPSFGGGGGGKIIGG